MRKLFLFLFIAMALVRTSAQENEYNYDDGFFVAFLSETNDEDIKCDIYPSEISEKDVQKLIDNGRYITSVVYTKNGGMILHKKNTEGVKQIYLQEKYDIEKICKQQFKKGYVLNYYNAERGYAIFNHNTKAKNMKIISYLNQKKLNKLNEKRMFAKYIRFGFCIAYDGQDEIKEQVCAYANSNDDLLEKFRKSPKTHFVSSVAKIFSKNLNKTSYEFISDIYKDGRECEQNLGRFESVERFTKYIKENISAKKNLVGLWCGWENYDYKAEEARIAAADNMNIFDILGGLTNSISGLTGHNNNSTTESSPMTETSTGTSRGSTRTKTTGKCRRCQGSGKCSPTSGSDRKSACHGSGLCGYCNGTGWNKAGASEAKCTACNGKGKCKTCGGTGKCPVCHGSGK